MQTSQIIKVTLDYSQSLFLIQPTCEARRRARVLRALGLLLADSALFSAERKNGRFSIILAQPGSVVILGHFFMARTVPPSFVENGLKLIKSTYTSNVGDP